MGILRIFFRKNSDICDISLGSDFQIYARCCSSISVGIISCIVPIMVGYIILKLENENKKIQEKSFYVSFAMQLRTKW